MFFHKYKHFCGSLLAAACLTIAAPSVATMTPAQHGNITLRGLSQHQQRDTTAVIALSQNTFDDKKTTAPAAGSISDRIKAILNGENSSTDNRRIRKSAFHRKSSSVTTMKKPVKRASVPMRHLHRHSRKRAISATAARLHPTRTITAVSARPVLQ